VSFRLTMLHILVQEAIFHIMKTWKCTQALNLFLLLR